MKYKLPDLDGMGVLVRSIQPQFQSPIIKLLQPLDASSEFVKFLTENKIEIGLLDGIIPTFIMEDRRSGRWYRHMICPKLYCADKGTVLAVMELAFLTDTPGRLY